MKVTYDAVNEFKGEWEDYKHLVFKVKSTGKLYFSQMDLVINEAAHELVCHKKEFNDLVLQMETNFGKCSDIAISHWKKCTKELLTKSTKELEVMDIDWSKAPHWATEYATYAIIGELDGYKYWLGSNGFLIVGDESVSMSIYGTTSRDSDNDVATNHKKSDFHVLVTRPQPIPTYTQAMADNGEFPSVGVECVGTSSRGLVMTSWEKGSIIFTSPTYTIFKTSNGIEFCCDHLLGQDFKYKPLTPPIELLDGNAYQFDYGNTKLIIGLYSKQNKQLQALAGHYESKYCTNIQSLIVEKS